MNYSELLEEVRLITNRPDLVDETASAVRAATLKAHLSDYYSRDLYEEGVEFTGSSALQSLDLYKLISNFRTLKYFRRVDDAADTEGTFLQILTPEEIFDPYGVSRTDIAYVAGRILEIRAATPFQYGLLGCYVFPIVTEAGYSSWVADLQPYAIVYEACRKIFAITGQKDKLDIYTSAVAEEYGQLKMLGLTDVGY